MCDDEWIHFISSGMEKLDEDGGGFLHDRSVLGRNVESSFDNSRLEMVFRGDVLISLDDCVPLEVKEGEKVDSDERD